MLFVQKLALELLKMELIVPNVLPCNKITRSLPLPINVKFISKHYRLGKIVL